MLNKIKSNLVFSTDFKSRFKSIWIGALLITWTCESLAPWYKTIDFNWYGLDYWYDRNEVESKWRANK